MCHGSFNVVLIAIALLPSCRQTTETPSAYYIALNDSVSTAHIADSLAIIQREDSLYNLYKKGELFYSPVIRVTEGKEQFLFNEIEEEDSVVALDATGREAFYRDFRKGMKPELLKAHQLAWSLKEMQMQQAGNGGIGTVMTWLTDTPAAGQPYYKFFIKRMYEDRIGTVIPIPFVLVNVKTKEIFLESMNSGAVISLKEWRRNGGGFKDE